MTNCLALCLLLVNAILISGAPAAKDNSMEDFIVVDAMNAVKDALTKFGKKVEESKKSIKAAYDEYEYESEMLFKSGKEETSKDFNPEQANKLNAAAAKFEKRVEDQINTMKLHGHKCYLICGRYKDVTLKYATNLTKHYESQIAELLKSGKKGTTQEKNIKEKIKALKAATAKYGKEIERLLKFNEALSSNVYAFYLEELKVYSAETPALSITQIIPSIKASAAAAKFEKNAQNEINAIAKAIRKCGFNCAQYAKKSLNYLKDSAAKYESNIEKKLESGKEDTQEYRIEKLSEYVQEDTPELSFEEAITSMKADAAAKLEKEAEEEINHLRTVPMKCADKCGKVVLDTMKSQKVASAKFESEIKKLSESGKADAQQDVDIAEGIKALKAVVNNNEVDIETKIKSLKAAAAKYGLDIEEGIKSLKSAAAKNGFSIEDGIKALKAAAAKHEVDIEERIKSLKAAAAKHESDIKKILKYLKEDQPQESDAKEQIKSLRARIAHNVSEMDKILKSV